MISRHPSRPEDAHLTARAVGLEDAERVPHFFETAIEDLQIEHVEAVDLEPQDRSQEVFEEHGLGIGVWQRQQLLELLPELLFRNGGLFRHRQRPVRVPLSICFERSLGHPEIPQKAGHALSQGVAVELLEIAKVKGDDGRRLLPRERRAHGAVVRQIDQSDDEAVFGNEFRPAQLRDGLVPVRLDPAGQDDVG